MLLYLLYALAVSKKTLATKQYVDRVVDEWAMAEAIKDEDIDIQAINSHRIIIKFKKWPTGGELEISCDYSYTDIWDEFNKKLVFKNGSIVSSDGENVGYENNTIKLSTPPACDTLYTCRVEQNLFRANTKAALIKESEEENKIYSKIYSKGKIDNFLNSLEERINYKIEELHEVVLQHRMSPMLNEWTKETLQTKKSYIYLSSFNAYTPQRDFSSLIGGEYFLLYKFDPSGFPAGSGYYGMYFNGDYAREFISRSGVDIKDFAFKEEIEIDKHCFVPYMYADIGTVTCELYIKNNN